MVLGESPSKAGVDVPTLSESNSNQGGAPTNCSAATLR
jgi:hypothetical protein